MLKEKGKERHPRSDANSGSTRTPLIEYIKVIGGLSVAIAGILEFSAHNEEERAAAILSASQLVMQGEGAVGLHKNMDTVIKPFFTEYQGDITRDLKKREYDKVQSFIYSKILPKNSLAFNQMNLIWTQCINSDLPVHVNGKWYQLPIAPRPFR